MLGHCWADAPSRSLGNLPSLVCRTSRAGIALPEASSTTEIDSLPVSANPWHAISRTRAKPARGIAAGKLYDGTMICAESNRIGWQCIVASAAEQNDHAAV